MTIGKDKWLHAIVCFVATVAVGGVMSIFGKGISLSSGILFSCGLGFGKEFGDLLNPNSKWDWMDLIADLVGTAVGTVLLIIGWSVL